MRAYSVEQARIVYLITRAREALTWPGETLATQRTLARYVRVSPSTVSEWLRGTCVPSPRHVVLLETIASSPRGPRDERQGSPSPRPPVEEQLQRLHRVPTDPPARRGDPDEGQLVVTRELELVYDGIVYRLAHARATPIVPSDAGRWAYGGTEYASELVAARARARTIAWATGPEDLRAYLRALHEAIHTGSGEGECDPITLGTSGAWLVYERLRLVRSCGTLLHALYTCATRGAQVGWAIDDVVRSRLAIAKNLKITKQQTKGKK